ncbi:MAG: hypothetical protein H7A34_07860 [bacterium]|nr:hypothetical protein [bacterium]
MKKALLLTAVFCFIFTVFHAPETYAREKNRSGSYQGRKGSGTFQRNVTRTNGQSIKSTTWQNERGEGNRQTEKNWDNTTGTGSYSSSTTNAAGKTISRSGTVTKNEDGSFTKQGTITGTNGNTATVQSAITKNEDGGRSITKTYTGQDGNTFDINKTIQKTETGRTVSGNYSSSAGESGTFESTKTVSDGTVTKEQTLTNQDQETWQRNIERTQGDGTVTRDVTTVNPDGETNSFSQTATFDKPDAGN